MLHRVCVQSNNATGSGDLKQRMEEQLKQQRAVFQQQQRDGRTLLKISSISSTGGAKPSGLVTPVKTVTTVAASPPTKKLMRTRDGRIISVQTLGSIQPTSSSVGNTTIFPVSSGGGGLPKVQIASHSTSKVIRLQTVPANPRMILPRAPRPMIQTTTPNANLSPATIRLPNQNIQILRMPDGQIQVKGLLEGQQMIQRPDGKFHLINNSSSSQSNVVNVTNKNLSSVPGNAVQVTQQKTHIVKPIQLQQQQQIVKVNGQQVLLRKDGGNTKVVSVGAGEAIKGNMLSPQQTNSCPPQVKTILSSDGSMVKTVVGNVMAASGGTSAVTVSPPAASNTLVKTEGSSLTLRVQVRMTEQGPKTIIQGLQPTVGLTKDHIRAIQQQVRSMLAQYNLKVNQLSPIMTLTLHIASQSQPTQPSQPQNVSPNVTPISKEQLTQQHIIKQVPGSPNKNIIQAPSLKLPTVVAMKNNNNVMGTNLTTGNTYIRTASGAVLPVINKTSPRVVVGADVVKGGPPNSQQKSFELTNDYIQQTIQSALNSNDLSPDVEEKLVQYKKYSTEQSISGKPHLQIPIATPSNKRPRDVVSTSSYCMPN